MDGEETQFGFADTATVVTQKPKPAAKDHRHGHRARLRERFLAGGPEGMPEYELLELILFLAIPRRDVKPLAKSLIERFGGYAGVLSADVAALRAFPSLGDTAVAAIKSVQASALFLARSHVQEKPLLSNWKAVESYLQGAMAHLPREQFRLLLLDRKNALIAEDTLSEGTVDQTAVYPREILRKALNKEASALILVHNHPSGDPSPSDADITMTKEIVEACTKVGIQVHDHIIIGKFGQSSFRQLGLL
ncbi:MAG: DNA repair protein RadC [Kordiimonadaceae bacterium]|nr:DNA repair protein RadC [Kordiimonadaceae bacterium]